MISRFNINFKDIQRIVLRLRNKLIGLSICRENEKEILKAHSRSRLVIFSRRSTLFFTKHVEMLIFVIKLNFRIRLLPCYLSLLDKMASILVVF